MGSGTVPSGDTAALDGNAHRQRTPTEIGAATHESAGRGRLIERHGPLAQMNRMVAARELRPGGRPSCEETRAKQPAARERDTVASHEGDCARGRDRRATNDELAAEPQQEPGGI